MEYETDPMHPLIIWISYWLNPNASKVLHRKPHSILSSTFEMSNLIRIIFFLIFLSKRMKDFMNNNVIVCYISPFYEALWRRSRTLLRIFFNLLATTLEIILWIPILHRFIGLRPLAFWVFFFFLFGTNMINVLLILIRENLNLRKYLIKDTTSYPTVCHILLK